MKSAMHGESGYKRLPNDQYMTPSWVTEALVENYPLPFRLWEPAAGNGAMLLRNEYDCAKSRHHLFANHPLRSFMQTISGGFLKKLGQINLPDIRDRVHYEL